MFQEVFIIVLFQGLFVLLYILVASQFISFLSSRLFADDKCLTLNQKLIEKLHQKINAEFAEVSNWMISNKLTLNLIKHNIIIT